MSPAQKIAPSKAVLGFKKPRLFTPAYTRQVTTSDGTVVQASSTDVLDTNIDSTASFRYDPPGAGVRSTQQIPLDWSLFENHTFFNSAEVNVNVAFNKIINEFPFDGTRKEAEAFLDELTGFEKYVYDQFPKNVGYLFFSGSGAAGGGSYINVNDFAGSSYPTLSKDQTGRSLLDPGEDSLSLEMHLWVPGEANDNSVVAQKLSGSNHGFTLAISESASTTACDLVFMVTSGSHFMTESYSITKGVFNHIVVSLDRRPSEHRIRIYSGSVLRATSSAPQEFGKFGFAVSPLTIGSGSAQDVAVGSVFTPVTTLSGAIDEFRLFHSLRKVTEQEQLGMKGIYASDDLKLYFKFNEPTGSLGSLSNIVLDSSGNSLHSQITNFGHALRSTGSITVPMAHEKLEDNPVLFPAYAGVVSLNADLLTSASAYDDVNPNLITNLIPPHYLQEGQYVEGFTEVTGTIGDAYGGTGIPGTGIMGSAQILASFLYVWAKFFDEQKIVNDHLSNILHVDYDDDGTVSDQFLPQVFKYYGFDAPNFFAGASISQFVDAEDLGVDVGTSTQALQSVQNQLWRRILTNVREIIRSKGTIHAVKALIRSTGINPDTSLRIREFGGKTTRNLEDARVTKTEVSAMLDFSGSLAPVSSTLDARGIPDNKPFIQSGFLSASRVETGFPVVMGSMVDKSAYPPHGISDATQDGLLTSGSFTFEGLYKFPRLLTGSHYVTQSLMRLMATSSNGPFYLYNNFLAISGTDGSGSLRLWSRPARVTGSVYLDMPLTGVNIFDGDVWHVTWGRIEPGKMETATSGFGYNFVSASYFIRAGRQVNGQITEYVSTATFHDDSLGPPDTSDIMYSRIGNIFNPSGSMIVIGSQSIDFTSTGRFLNSQATASNQARVTDFSGRVAQVRFWSKDLTEIETKEHIRNFKSVGVENPRLNYNFDTVSSGAWERLRLNGTMDQPVTESDASGDIKLIDFSQNRNSFSGSGFEASTRVIKPETFYYSHLSPRFDEAGTDNKVRIRGFLDQDNIDEYDAEAAPVHEITPSEKPNDDTRFTIDFSVVDALDEDIITIFATLDDLDNVLGDPNLAFSPDYPGLTKIRDVYFNRLTDRMNLKALFEFFKWFDTSIGMFIEQILPRKTNYLGTNFVIESHMLERAKVKHSGDSQYLDETQRVGSVTSTVLDSGGTLER